MKTEKKLKIFEKELELIVDEGVRAAVKDALVIAPEYFWTIPSSLIHHPRDERKKGGRVLHAKRVARLAHDMVRMMNLRYEKRDAMVAAGILHDVCARGRDDYPSYPKTVVNHGRLALELLEDWLEPSHSFMTDDSYLMARFILTHMGNYGPDKPKTDIEWLFHYIDAMASRDFVKVKPL